MYLGKTDEGKYRHRCEFCSGEFETMNAYPYKYHPIRLFPGMNCAELARKERETRKAELRHVELEHLFKKWMSKDPCRRHAVELCQRVSMKHWKELTLKHYSSKFAIEQVRCVYGISIPNAFSPFIADKIIEAVPQLADKIRHRDNRGRIAA